MEGGPAQVRVNMIAPGGIDGDMVDEICNGYSVEAPDAARAAFIEQVPLARFSKGHEVAALALFLASDTSASCRGGVDPIDGGYAAG